MNKYRLYQEEIKNMTILVKYEEIEKTSQVIFIQNIISISTISYPIWVPEKN